MNGRIVPPNCTGPMTQPGAAAEAEAVAAVLSGKICGELFPRFKLRVFVLPGCDGVVNRWCL